MTDLRLKLAISHYDHVSDIIHGAVRPEGITVEVTHRRVEHVFYEMGTSAAWDASEFSMGKYVSYVAHGDRKLQGLPIFVSRMFRHSAFFVRTDSDVRGLDQLRGRRIGIPDWTQTAVIYGRAVLQHEHGIGLGEVEWVVGDVDVPLPVQAVPLHVPPLVRVERTERRLVEMLLAGEIDCILSAVEPEAVLDGDSRIRRVVDTADVEDAYHRSTGIYPIMHVLVVRRELVDAQPWIAGSLFAAFELAKANSLRRLQSANIAWLPFPWLHHFAREMVRRFDGDPWPYGVEPNRRTLEAFARFCHEQGVTGRPVTVEELFPPAVAALGGA